MPPTRVRTLIAVGAADAGVRLDLFLMRALGTISRQGIKQRIDQGKVRVGGRLERLAGRPVRAGELIEVADLAGPLEVAAELTAAHMRYVDPHLIAVDKPAGLGMHAVEKGDTHHLVAAVQRWCRDTGTPLEPGGPFLASRLDKETSGLVVLGLTGEAGRRLTDQFASRSVLKRYRAIVQGDPPAMGKIEGPIDALGQGRFGIRPGGSPARTLCRVCGRSSLGVDLEVTPETGRSHQIRVHLASIGCPIVGDLLYGGHRGTGISRCLLHSERLELVHPISGERLELTAPLPFDMDPSTCGAAASPFADRVP